MEKPEWGFKETPDEVDLNRLWFEWRSLPAAIGHAYLEQLYREAPKTYERLREWRLSLGCDLVSWDYDPDNRWNRRANESEG